MVFGYIFISFLFRIALSQKTTTDVCDFGNDGDRNCHCESLVLASIIEMQQNEIAKLKAESTEARNQHRAASIIDCFDVLNNNNKDSGVYVIDTGHFSQQVFCDMDTDGGGWTVFQRRQDGSVNFRQDWDTYKNGYGNVSGEHWLGNENLHRLTQNRDYELRADLEDWEGQTRYAKYSHIKVLSESQNYQLDIGSYSGTAGDSLSYHNGMQFSTHDRDNDLRSPSCISTHGYGGFWLNNCMRVGVNNYYSHSSSGYGAAIGDRIRWDAWYGYQYSLKSTRLMIRPIN